MFIFDKLYDVLYDILLKTRKFTFMFDGKQIDVEFRHDHKMFYVEVVHEPGSRIRMETYPSGKMELYNWFNQDDPKTIPELEKTIISLN